MELEHRFVCPLPNGLHARPASHLEALASRFSADVALFNERAGTVANAKSVLALIGADIHMGDPLLLRVTGSEAEMALEELTRFLRDDFADCDSELLETPSATKFLALPRSLQATRPEKILRGTVICPGLAAGIIKRAEGLLLTDEIQERLSLQKTFSNKEELARFHLAVAAVQLRLEEETASASGQLAEVLRAHASLLKDITFSEKVAKFLSTESKTVAHAILAVIDYFSTELKRSTNAYLRDRVLDLHDIGRRLLIEIYGEGVIMAVPTLDQPTLVVAETLTVGQFLAFKRDFLHGLILKHASTASHVVILARSFGIPTLVAVENSDELPEGSKAILDANLGLVLPNPNNLVRRYYDLERSKIEREMAQARQFVGRQGTSRDGRKLAVLANVSSAEEVAPAIMQGAEGIGLFRTEMLFIERASAPSEDEQATIYTAAAIAAQGKTITLRTFDIGGDKPAPYLKLPGETNPFLGYRGVRLYEEFEELLKTQLRAIFRAASHGSLQIMAPMISYPEEMRRFRSVVDEVQTQFAPIKVPIGMMIEVPSVAFSIGEFTEHAEFFSLGTNDLMQYFFALDRENTRLKPLTTAFSPAFLRMLKRIVFDVHQHGRMIGLCGEFGEKPEALPVLLGLELDSISLGAPCVLATKADLASLDFSACQKHVEELLESRDRDSADRILREFRLALMAKPLLSADLVEINSQSRTKHEAIKELTGLLASTGRVNDSAAVEEALWQREDSYSTGFGYGFALPHCQSHGVCTNSIALLRLPHPIDWNSLDGRPVSVIILLAMRSEDKGLGHLRVFSKLARLVMRDEFRAKLESDVDAQSILTTLTTELY